MAIPPVQTNTVWFEKIEAPDCSDAVAVLAQKCIESKEQKISKMKVECMVKVDGMQHKVLVVFRHDYRGLLSAELKKDGFIIVNTDNGTKTKYQIKVIASNIFDSAPLNRTLRLALALKEALIKRQLIFHDLFWVGNKEIDTGSFQLGDFYISYRILVVAKSEEYSLKALDIKLKRVK